MVLTWLTIALIPAVCLLLLALIIGILALSQWPRLCFRVGRRAGLLEAHASREAHNLACFVHEEVNPLLTLSGLQAAELLRARVISSVELVEACIAQIERVNPHLNAVVGTRFDDAVTRARLCDDVLDDPNVEMDDLPVFFGVPCLMKECFDVPGMPNTSGLVQRAGHRATYPATVVERLERGGGVITLGITNVSEACMWMESYNPLYRRTVNPFDCTTTPGGSSGGSAAAVAALAAPFALGSDVGGSIRMPAFFCGLFGHKPTGGAVPNTGQQPVPRGRANSYCQPGPIARHAEDLWPLLVTMAGPDGSDPWCTDMPHWEHPDDVEFDGFVAFNVVSADAPLVSSVEPALLSAQARAARFVERELGVPVVNIKLPFLAHSFDIWSSLLSTANGNSFADILFADLPHPDETDAAHEYQFHDVGDEQAKHPSVLFELAKLPFGKSNHSLPGLVLALFDKVNSAFSCLRNAKERNVRYGEWVRRHFHALMDGDLTQLKKLGAEIPDPAHRRKLYRIFQRYPHLHPDAPARVRRKRGPKVVLLCPTHPLRAPSHLFPLTRPFNWVYTAIWNALEVPATQCPLGVEEHEHSLPLPTGVQVVGAHGYDHHTIAFAMALEVKFGGYEMPSQDGHPVA